MNAKTCLSVLFLIFSTAFAAFGQIQVGKSVQISVLGIPAEEKGRIDGNYPVAENGTVNMPFIGAVRASGMRPEALASTLESRYKAAEIYRNPTFQVVADIGEGGMIEAMVHVGGQVRRNGPVKFNRGITLWQAIQAAGGPTEFGTMKRVAILREGKLRSYDVTQTQFMQIPLEPDDNITVPQKRPWEPN
jgi:protein involved in polysaccharide export with SLBB domain